MSPIAQVFHPSTNTFSKASVVAGGLVVVLAVWAAYLVERSPYNTQVRVVREQPVPFSHKHHVDGLGLDCRFCHTTVETSSFAGIPATKTCMTCHSQVWTGAPMLEPVRASYKNDVSIRWTRVHSLPDFAYFDHSIHVRKGVGCSTCHGRVDLMPLTWREETLQMEWCIGCHRDPSRYVRPRDQVFNMTYVPPPDQAALGAKLVSEYDIHTHQIRNCSVCHR